MDESAADYPLGSPNPDNPRQVCVECPDCGERRWVNIRVRGPKELKAKGWIFRDIACASKASRKRLRAAIPDIVLPSDSIVRPSKKNPSNPDEEEVVCGICHAVHYDCRRPRKNAKDGLCVAWKGYCEGCWPWARVALRPEHDTGPSLERDAIYAKIRDIRHALEETPRRILKGSQMPFCALAKEWDKQNLQANRNTRDTQSYNVKLLSFHFGTTPVGEISYDKGMEFKSFLLALSPTRGAERGSTRSELSVNQTLGVLRRIFDYACEQRWLRKNPFPVGGDFTPSRRVRKPTPLVTVDEERQLLAACTSKLDYLPAIIICLLDTGMNDADRQRLKWSDVDFSAGLIRGSGSPMRMTPRLQAIMLALRERSDPHPESLIWGSKNITGFKKDLGLARVTAQLQGLHISHLRPTSAWRMAQAGQAFLQIADVLGCKDTKYLRQYLETDPETAERESNSPSFKQFIGEQFCVSVNGDSGWQKNGGVEKRAQGRPRKPNELKKAEAADTLRRIQSTVLAMKSARRQRSEVTANLVASELGIGGITGGDTMMRQVNKCGSEISWPKLRDAIWDDSKIIPELFSSHSKEKLAI